MKRSLILCATAVLACGSLARAGFPANYDQQTPERPRRVELPSGSFMGAQLGEVNGETVQRLKLREERGALIEEVVPGSSASSGGLQKDDVVIKWDGEPIESAREMSRHIRETPAGRTVRLGVIREGRELEVSFKMGERAAVMVRPAIARPIARITQRPQRPIQLRQQLRSSGHLGVELNSMTDQLAEYFGLSKRTGALVVFVFADSPAAKAGLKAGDVILNFGAEKVENPMDLRRALTTKTEGPVEIRVLRDKQEKSFTVQLEKETRSWLLEPDDFDDLDVRVAIAPMRINIPPIRMAPMVFPTPRVAIAPVRLAMPKIAIPPMTVVVPKLAPMAVPSVRIAPIVINVPNLKLAPMAFPSPRFHIAPMRIQVPKPAVPPVKVVVVPRRVVM